jgi:hypothetical protein
MARAWSRAITAQSCSPSPWATAPTRRSRQTLLLGNGTPAASPPPLVEQLKVGGRLVMPLGPVNTPQQLTVIEKIAPSETRMRSIILVNFVPFTRSQD